MAVVAKKKPAAGSGENASITVIYASGKPVAWVKIKTNLNDGSVAQDRTDLGQITITDILGLAYHTVTTLS